MAFVNAELEKVRAIPGVTSAGAISRIPLTVTDNSRFYFLAGQSGQSFSKQIALTRVVSRGYFATVGAQLRQGRFFEASDQRSESPAVIVNESFANRNYSGRSPLGERLKFERLNENGYWYRVVGVVKEIRERGVAEDSRPAIYRVHAPRPPFEGAQTAPRPTLRQRECAYLGGRHLRTFSCRSFPPSFSFSRS